VTLICHEPGPGCGAGQPRDCSSPDARPSPKCSSDDKGPGAFNALVTTDGGQGFGLAADGDIAAIPPEQGVLCTEILAPVTAQATGTWAGTPVSYGPVMFDNSCLANVQTGGDVFSF
jgi:hypothetical protein